MSENAFCGPKRGSHVILAWCLRLVLTLGVNYHDLVVRENDEAGVYSIPEQRIHPIYLSPNTNNIKKHMIKQKNK